MQAPTESELKQIQKVETKLMAPKINIKRNADGDGGPSTSNFLGMPNKKDGPMLSKASINQASNASLNEKRVADNFARPMAL